MSKEDLLTLLRAHLRVTVETRTSNDWGSKGYVVEVKLLLDDEVIDESSDTIEVAYRDTSESWRPTLED